MTFELSPIMLFFNMRTITKFSKRHLEAFGPVLFRCFLLSCGL